MNSQLTVSVRNVYGTETVYPACDTSRLLCRLTGRKTFTHADIRNCKALGYAFNVQSQPTATASLLAAGNG
jgi:hypothetical protein